MRTKIEEKAGKCHGNWIVLKFDRIDEHDDARWWCQCALCGDIYSVKGYTLRNGHSTKCLPCAKRMRLNGR